jgi:ELWxxDGT repeat protein
MLATGRSRVRVLVRTAALLAASLGLASGALAQAMPLRVKQLTTPDELRQATSRPAEFTKVGSTTYFVAEDHVNGRELWKTDGTAAGTVLVRDIWPGNDVNNGPRSLFNFNGVLLFTATDGRYGLELWRSDGTATGTVMVKDIEPSYGGSEPRNFIDGGDQVFFDASVSHGEVGFWRTDGTSAGTYRVKVGGACCFGDGSCQVLSPPVCEAMHGWAQPPLSACAAVACDQPVAFVCCLPNGLCKFQYANLCAAQGGTLLPAGSTCLPRMCPALPPAACCLADQQCVLLMADECAGAGGLARGAHATCAPADLCTCAPAPCTPAFVRCCYPDGSCVLSQTGAACTATGGVWSAPNITCEAAMIQCVQTLIGCCLNDGTCRVDELASCLSSGGMPKTYGSGVCSTAVCAEPSPSAGAVGVPVQKVGDRIFIYNAVDEHPQRGLWVWDGTPTGFTFLKSFPAFNSNQLQVPRFFNELNGKLVFAMSDGNSGYEWWSSDGTPAGTMLVADINPGAAHAVQTDYATATPVKAGGFIYFFAEDGTHGRQLWRTDGAGAGTTRLTNLPNLSNYTGPIMPVEGGVTFFAYQSAGGNRLYGLNPSDPAGCSLLWPDNFSIYIDPSQVCNGGGRAFFAQRGLWVTDGTVGGTSEIMDSAQLGRDPTDPRWVAGLDRVMFSAGEPWVSDGTPAGTHELRDISSGVNTLSIKPAGGDNLVFAAPDGPNGYEPFVSDGSPEGTVAFADINPGAAHSLPANFTRVGEQMFFTANSPGRTQSLWVSDLTGPGTHIVGDTSNTPYFQGVGAGVAVGSKVFFVGSYSDGVRRLWCRENGQFTELPGITGSFPQLGNNSFQQFGVRGSVLYLITSTGLWRSDGTPSGTFQLKAAPDFTLVQRVLVLPDEVAFLFQGDLWHTDGTVAGTVRADPLFNPTQGGWVYAPSSMGVFFASGTSENYGRLYRSGLTPGTTQLVKDFSQAQGNVRLSGFIEYNGLLYFLRLGSTVDLYRTDGTPDGTVPVFPPQATLSWSPLDVVNGRLLVHSFNTTSRCWTLISTTGTQASNESLTPCFGNQSPLFVMKVGSIAYYTAFPGLWRTDGTLAGTYSVAGAAGLSFSTLSSGQFAVYQGQLYFAASRADVGNELFRIDPTNDAITLVADLNPGAGSSSPSALAASTSELVFNASIGEVGRLWALASPSSPPSVALVPPSPPMTPFQASNLTASGDHLYCTDLGDNLIRTDGTIAGTLELGDFSGIASGAHPHDFIDFDGKLMFVGYQPATGEDIYVADPVSPAAPRRIDISDDYPQTLTRVGNRIFFITRPSAGGDRLNVTDGTQAGTIALQSPAFEIVNSTLTRLDEIALFAADDYTHGSELWRSDGTSAGTYLVKDLNPGRPDSVPSNFAAFGGFVYFTADDGVHGRELWRSDGTEAGTTLVRDIWIGGGSANPTWLTPTGNRLHFVAYTPETGPELWITDGTPGGTFMLFQLADGPGGANINQLTVSGDRLYFLATVLPDGTSLWTYEWPGALRAFCRGDYDRLGGVSVGDIFAFLHDWFSLVSRADFSGDGVIGVQDIFDFLEAYFGGCGF